LLDIGWNQSACEQPRARLRPVAFDVEHGSRAKSASRATGVYPADETPDPFERPAVFQLRGTTAAAREHSEPKAAVLVQRANARGNRRDHRDLGIRKLAREFVLLGDLRVAPAS